LGWGLHLFPPSTDCGRFEVKKDRYSASPFWGAIAGAAKVSKGWGRCSPHASIPVVTCRRWYPSGAAWGRSYPGSPPYALPECDPVGHLGADGDVEGVLVGLGPDLQDVPPWADGDSLGLSVSAVMQDLLACSSNPNAAVERVCPLFQLDGALDAGRLEVWHYEVGVGLREVEPL